MRRRDETVAGGGFTLVELLVTVALVVALALMASASYMSHLKAGEEAVLKQNLNTLRGAIQQFYADNGRFPFRDRDVFSNRVSFLDDATSELVQGPFLAANKYPQPRHRYLAEIPIDPSTNAKNWILICQPLMIRASSFDVVTDVRSTNPQFQDL